MKPTASLYARVRRLPLTTKQVSNGFYKGTGTGAMGRHTKHGGYIIEWRKVRTYVVPEQLKDCKVCDYASSGFAGTYIFAVAAHTICHEEDEAYERTVRRRREGRTKWGRVFEEMERGERSRLRRHCNAAQLRTVTNE